MAAVAAVANGSHSTATAAWPSLGTFYSYPGGLDAYYDQVTAAARGTVRVTAAGVQTLLGISGAALTSNATILQVTVP